MLVAINDGAGMTHVQHLRELGYTIVATPHEYYVEYQVFAHLGTSVTDDTLLFHKLGDDSAPSPTDDLTKAEIFLHGEVKWDGCANWHFDECERVMIHTCGRDDIADISAILTACWDWTKELLPTWQDL